MPEITYHSDTISIGERIHYNDKDWCLVAWGEIPGEILSLYLMEINGKESCKIYANLPKYIGNVPYETIRRKPVKQKTENKYPTVAEIREQERLLNEKQEKKPKKDDNKTRRSNTNSTSKSRKRKND